MIKASIFDLDDTLLDRDQSIEAFIEYQYKKFDIARVPFDDFRKQFYEMDQHGYGDKNKLYQTFVRKYSLPYQIEELVREFRIDAWDDSQLYSGVNELLEQLRAQAYKLGLVTNGLEQTQKPKIRIVGLDQWMDTILISGIEKVRKPDVEIFRRASERIGVDAAHCVFVGDNPKTDIKGANGFGMKTVWIKRHISWPKDLNIKPDFSITELHELLKILK